jgi:1,4-dihydroxy-2-naphthoate octaprenyltransferase
MSLGISRSIQMGFPLRAVLIATRPKTLTAALVPIVVGSALAYGATGLLHRRLCLYALCSAFLIQIGTNLINDALDFKKGADTAERLGPQRVTQSGLLQMRTVFWGGLACFLGATLFGIPLVIAGGWLFVGIGLFSLLAGYCYTGGPFPLAYIGLGDPFVLIFFGWLAVGGVYALHVGYWDEPVWVAGTQVGLLATVMIAINHLRDGITDQKVDKKTFTVRFGKNWVRYEIAFLCFMPFLIGFYWWYQGWRWAFVLPGLMMPLAMTLVRNVFQTEPSPIYNQYLAKAALLHLGFGICLAIGFGIGA